MSKNNFEATNMEFRAHWNMGREAARNAAIKLNELIRILHDDNPEWSISKIANHIWVKNEELDGFTRKTIYNNLDDENRQLIDARFQKGQNNVLEESDVTLHPNVPEDSSSKYNEDGIVTGEPTVINEPTTIQKTPESIVNKWCNEQLNQIQQAEEIAFNHNTELDTTKQLLQHSRSNNEKLLKRCEELEKKLVLFNEVKEIDIGFDEPLRLKITVNPLSERNKITSVIVADSNVLNKIKRRLGL